MLDMHAALYPPIPLALVTLSTVTKLCEPMCLLMVCDGLCKTMFTRIRQCWIEFDEDESCNERSALKLEVGCTAILSGAVYAVPVLEDIPQL